MIFKNTIQIWQFFMNKKMKVIESSIDMMKFIAFLFNSLLTYKKSI